MSSNKNDDSDGTQLTSFVLRFQTKENERLSSVTIMFAGLLRRSMVCEVDRVLRE